MVVSVQVECLTLAGLVVLSLVDATAATSAGGIRRRVQIFSLFCSHVRLY